MFTSSFLAILSFEFLIFNDEAYLQLKIEN